MAEPSNPTAAEPASSSATCAHAARRLPTEPPGFAKGPPHASIPSLPHLPSLKLIHSCLKLIHSCPNPPGWPGSSGWPLLPAVPSRLPGGPGQMLPAGTHTSGPVSCRRPAVPDAGSSPAAQPVQPGPWGCREEGAGKVPPVTGPRSNPEQGQHRDRLWAGWGRHRTAPRESRGIAPVMLNLCKLPALTCVEGLGDVGSSKQQGLGEDRGARLP